MEMAANKTQNHHNLYLKRSYTFFPKPKKLKITICVSLKGVTPFPKTHHILAYLIFRFPGHPVPSVSVIHPMFGEMYFLWKVQHSIESWTVWTKNTWRWRRVHIFVLSRKKVESMSLAWNATTKGTPKSSILFHGALILCWSENMLEKFIHSNNG